MRGSRSLLVLMAALLAVLAGRLPAQEGPDAGAPPKVQPIPSPEKLKQAETLVREIFGEDLKKPGRENELAVALKMIEGAETAKDDPAGKYRLLSLAADLAIRNADWGTAQKALGKIASSYEVDRTKLMLDSLAACQKDARGKEQFQDLARGALDLADQEVEVGEYDNALAYLERAGAAARISQDTELATTVHKKEVALRQERGDQEKIKQAQAKLKTSPDDPAANLALGRHYALGRQDWAKGLPYLVKCGEPRWAEAAKADLAQPAEAPEQIAVADRWYDLWKTSTDADKEAFQQRALFWLDLAAPKAAGLHKLRVEKLLAELRPGGGKPGEPNPAAVLNGTKPPVGPDTPAPAAQGLPTQEEWAELQRLADGDKDREFRAKASALRYRITASPETWTNADFMRRIAADKTLMDLARKALSGPEARSFASTSYLLTTIPPFIGASDGPGQLLQRFDLVRTELPKLDLPSIRYSSPMLGPTDGLRAYFAKQSTRYPTPQARREFCDYLMQNGVSAFIVRPVKLEQGK